MDELNLSTVQPDIKKLLLIGPEGSGKTHFIGTMPKPIYIFSFDKGYLTLAGEPGVTVGLCMDENRYSPHAYADFKRRFDELKKGAEYTWPDGKKEKYKTVAIDSLSFLSTFMFDHEQRVNNNIDKPGGFGVYGAVKSKMQDVVNQAVMLAEYVVCTALVEATKDDLTGEIFYVPSIVGSIKNEIGAWFDAVFYMVVDKNPNTGDRVFKLLTVGDRRQKAKVRLPSALLNRLAASENPDFQSLITKITGGK
jgi:hypothetical protein